MSKKHNTHHFQLFNFLNNTKDKMECCICILSIKKKDLGFLKCKHYFHIDCIKKWLEKKQDCPICRKESSSVFNIDKKEIKVKLNPTLITPILIPRRSSRLESHQRLHYSQSREVIQLKIRKLVAEREAIQRKILKQSHQRLHYSQSKEVIQLKIRKLVAEREAIQRKILKQSVESETAIKKREDEILKRCHINAQIKENNSTKYYFNLYQEKKEVRKIMNQSTRRMKQAVKRETSLREKMKQVVKSYTAEKERLKQTVERETLIRERMKKKDEINFLQEFVFRVWT